MIDSKAPLGCPCADDEGVGVGEFLGYAVADVVVELTTTRDLVAHWLQAMQPRMGLLPIQRISVSMPSVASCWATSLRARAVLPFWRGLPLISNTFMVLFIWMFLDRKT